MLRFNSLFKIAIILTLIKCCQSKVIFCLHFDKITLFADAAKEQLISANVVGESLSFLKTCNDKITRAIMNALCELIKDGNHLFHAFVCYF